MSSESATGSRWRRTDGYTADAVDRIPDLPPHTELIDGHLVLVRPRKVFHSLMVDLLAHALRAAAPRPAYRVRRQMSVVLGSPQRPEPDVIFLRAVAVDTAEGHVATWYPADAVVWRTARTVPTTVR